MRNLYLFGALQLSSHINALCPAVDAPDLIFSSVVAGDTRRVL